MTKRNLLVTLALFVLSAAPGISSRVYLANSPPPIRQELWVENPAGVHLKLSPPLAEHRNVVLFKVSSDGLTVVYIADIATDNNMELWSVPISGGATTQIASVPADYDVPGDFLFTGDSKWVIYRKARAALGAANLYSASVNGGNSELRLSQIGTPWASVKADYVVSGGRVRYSIDVDTTGNYKTYLVPVREARPMAEIFSDGFESGGVTRWN